MAITILFIIACVFLSRKIFDLKNALFLEIILGLFSPVAYFVPKIESIAFLSDNRVGYMTLIMLIFITSLNKIYELIRYNTAEPSSLYRELLPFLFLCIDSNLLQVVATLCIMIYLWISQRENEKINAKFFIFLIILIFSRLELEGPFVIVPYSLILLYYFYLLKNRKTIEIMLLFTIPFLFERNEKFMQWSFMLNGLIVILLLETFWLNNKLRNKINTLVTKYTLLEKMKLNLMKKKNFYYGLSFKERELSCKKEELHSYIKYKSDMLPGLLFVLIMIIVCLVGV